LGFKTVLFSDAAHLFPRLYSCDHQLHLTPKCDGMVNDVSRAIGWVVNSMCKMDERWWQKSISCAAAAPCLTKGKIGSTSGLGAPLVLMGHSAGAQLCALTLVRKCGLANLFPGTGDERECSTPREPEVPSHGWDAKDVSVFVGIRSARPHAWILNSRRRRRVLPTQSPAPLLGGARTCSCSGFIDLAGAVRPTPKPTAPPKHAPTDTHKQTHTYTQSQRGLQHRGPLPV